jgi:hypothetical protein
MQIVNRYNSNVIKVPASVEVKEPYHKVLFGIIDELQIHTIEEVETIRAMITNGNLLESEGEGMIILLNSRNIKLDPFQITKQKLQQVYTETKPTLLEGKVLTILANEEKAIHESENVNGNGNLIANNDQDQELRGRRRKTKQFSRRVEN